eukprot:g4903.t1
MKVHGVPLGNALGSTLTTTTIGLPFFFIWHFYYGVTVHLGGFGLEIASFAIGVPGAGAFGTIAFLNLALMWLQVAESSKTMKKTGSNVSGKFKIFVICFSVLITIMLFVLMGALAMYTIGALCVIVFLILIAVAYLVGSRKLVNVMSSGAAKGKKKSPRLMLIVRTARVIASMILGGLVFEIVYIVLTLMDPTTPGLRFVPNFCIAVFNTALVIAVGQICRFIQVTSATKRGVKVAAKGTASNSTVASTSGDESDAEDDGAPTNATPVKGIQ